MREMKDSGVAWIGEIPSVWKIVKLKNVGTIQTGATPTKTEQALYYSSESGVPWIKAENLGTFNPIIRATEYLTDEGCKQGRVFPPNTVYICCIASVGKVGYSTISCSCNQQINGIVFNSNMFWKYGFYMSIAQETLYSVYASGNVMKIINSERQANLLCPVPEYTEQQKIAAHLDRKCTQIDALISNAQQQIEKLKAYKQSVITETVLKGLDPDVPMKDSGVEWIGEIPEHCSLVPMKYLAEEIGDGIHSTPNYDINGDIFFINGNNIGEERIQFKESTNRINAEELAKYKAPHLTDNTIMISLNGTYGKASFYNGEPVLLGKSAGYITLKPSINKKYIRYYLQSGIAKLIMDLSLAGTTIPNLSLRTLNAFLVIYPELQEQDKMVAYLDRKCTQIDKLIALKQQKIEKLQQYKKSLIYEYVTGKKEV